ncbi:AfsR/SARP family transcriptional regulator [Nocardia otitidiscaviarum]|uniref:BTAD domain-containing putative transcriptional regulator n=1 Tax=Nocardia otitidiscaviarum TaxID=1823 RepID=UPI00189338E6|nr:BTAD domain-containing putative transcriptional regulator [Nocardia otitidiscaviarum]MBF6134162.1 AfsR/SARP family transcriptional regulator [Nocardia otitidiscaviarum]
MRVDVLGPLRVEVDGRTVAVGGARLRALVTRLALDAGRVVGAAALVEALWADGVPEHPAAALQSAVSRLRRTLPEAVVCAEAGGYRLDIPADTVDVVRFETLAGEGRRALRAGRAEAAEELLTRALALWRGEPLADVARLPFATAPIARLAELRRQAVEDRVEARLGRADPALLSAELRELVAADPLRERPRVLLIRTLAYGGRQAEALAAYEAYRAVLAEELGVDPPPELRELHLRLLRGDPPLDTHPPTEPREPHPRPPRGVPLPGAGSAAGRAGGNLRAPLTSCIGRVTERREVAERLRDGRLTTLVGPGGVGKTRLAVTAGAEVSDTVWIVDLAAAAEPDGLPRLIARTLGIRERGDISARVAEALSGPGTLLILDGCEHVVGAAARLADEALGRCPSLRILATSREPLGITGEVIYPVHPLDLTSAAALFIERARAVQPDFTTDPDVERICRLLDGLPLAIELAAVRLRSMSLATLVDRLDDRFRILTAGSRTAPPRHRTLGAVVAWSWDLLTCAERAAAEVVSVFPASFTVEAAERVGLTVDLLHGLVDKSLLTFDTSRFRMLDTIREYGRKRLADTGRLRAARTNHAACYLDLAERAEPHLRGSDQLAWLTRLTAERENLDAALSFATSSGDTDTALRLAAALGMFWTVHGDHAAATTRLRAALLLPGAGPGNARARAHTALLLNAVFAGTPAETETAAAEPEMSTGAENGSTRGNLPTLAASATNTVVDPEGGPTTATGSATVADLAEPPDPFAVLVRALRALCGGDFAAGVAAVEPNLAQADSWLRGMSWLVRSLLHGAAGDIDRGSGDLVEAVAGFRAAGERWGLSLSLMSRASVLITAGVELDAALGMLDEATTLARELGTHDGQRVWLAMVRIDAGDRTGARTQLLETLDRAAAPRDHALARVCLATLARYDGDLAAARRHLDLAEPHCGAPPERVLHATAAGFLDAAVGDLDTADRHLSRARVLAGSMPDPPMLALVAVGSAELRWRRGDPRGAAELLGIADAICGGPNSGNPDIARLRLRLRLGERDREYEADYARGRTLDRARALAALGIAD